MREFDTLSSITNGADVASERRLRKQNNKVTARIEIAATPPAIPPAMGPTFELCRPAGIGGAVLEAA